MVALIAVVMSLTGCATYSPQPHTGRNGGPPPQRVTPPPPPIEVIRPR